MLDQDLARLYGVPSKVLMQAVKRNAKRFPSDFMYSLTRQEVMNLRSQIVTSSWGGAQVFALRLYGAGSGDAIGGFEKSASH